MAAIKGFVRTHSRIIWIGLFTGGAIILFQVISLFVVYRYLRLDFYLCLVAVCFLGIGWKLNKRRSTEMTSFIPHKQTIRDHKTMTGAAGKEERKGTRVRRMLPLDVAGQPAKAVVKAGVLRLARMIFFIF